MTMKMNGVHAHVSPMITAARASHGSVTHVKSRTAEGHEQRLEGTLGGVSHHLEHVTDADRGDRQGDEEDDPEEASAGDALDGQDRQAEPEQVLQRDPDEDEDQGDDQRPRAGRPR